MCNCIATGGIITGRTTQVAETASFQPFLPQGFGASGQQVSGALNAVGSSYGQQQQQGQQGYGAYGQQTAYAAQQYGQQQVGQKRDGDSYAYSAGYGADYNKRPRY